MKEPIKILYIDADYQVAYTIIREGGVIRSTLPLQTALTMLENETFDLILSEPQLMAVFTSKPMPDNLEPILKFFPDLSNNSNSSPLFSRFLMENRKLRPGNFNERCV